MKPPKIFSFLAAQTGHEQIELIISPTDFRQHELPADTQVPQWINPVYARIGKRLKQLPPRAKSSFLFN